MLTITVLNRKLVFSLIFTLSYGLFVTLKIFLFDLVPFLSYKIEEKQHSRSLALLVYWSPLCSFSNRFSPSGSVVSMTERYRARSESPGRVDEPKQLSSQVCSFGLRVAVLVEELVTE